MTAATKTVVDDARLGRRGMPRFPEVFGIDLPMKTVPLLEDGTPDYSHPGLTPEEIEELEGK